LSRETRIDDYIANAEPFARPILDKVRERVHANLPEIEEAMKWSMPAYLLGGKILLITAAFKNHAALNFWRGQELRGTSASADAMGQFGQITSIDGLPSDAELDALILHAAELSTKEPGARKPKHVPKPAPLMHPEFASALVKAPKAKTMLESFPPSAQRDYFEWIAEAKQDSTRQKRIATAIEWLSEGKRRHWKYQSC
jgi:uncharacterized protein YdeI (YjbR/CyaY-like superfamily)